MSSVSRAVAFALAVVGAAVVVALVFVTRSPGASDCQGRVDDLRAFFETLVDEGYGSIPGPRREIDIVLTDWEGPTVPTDRRGPLVEIGPESLSWRDGPLADSRELQSELAAERERLGEAGALAGNASVFFAIDAAATWERVAEAADAAVAAGWESGVIVLEKPWALEPPPSAIDDEIEAYLAPREARELGGAYERRAALYEEVYGSCPAAMDAYEGRQTQRAEMSSADLEAWLIEDLPAAVNRCDCDVEFASIKAYHWIEAGRPAPLYFGVPVDLASPGDAHAHEASAAPAQSWEDTHELILRAVASGADAIHLRADDE